jgi:uncharacterized membrane protein YeiH
VNAIVQYFQHLFSYITFGDFVILNLIAATTNALNGGLLAQRPDYYRRNYWTIVGILLLAVIAMLTAFGAGQKFRETYYQFMTSFSLPWVAAIGVQASLDAKLPGIACIAMGVIGPTAGRYFIDLTAERTA